VLETVDPDEVYNLGAQSHVKVSFDIPEYTAEVVAIGTLRLIEAVHVLPPQRQPAPVPFARPPLRMAIAAAAGIRHDLIMPGVWGAKRRSRIGSSHCSGDLRSLSSISFTATVGI